MAALAPRKEGADLVNPASSGVFGIAGQVFNCEDYYFPGSMSWNTSSGEIWNEFFQLKIEILTDACHEMKIKVTGTKTGDYPDASRTTVPLSTSVTMNGQIIDLKGQTLTGITLQLANDYEYTDIVESIDVEVGADGRYNGVFKNLEPSTFYYTRVIYHLEDGDFYYDDATTTKRAADPSICVISFFRGLTENDSAYEMKVDAGEPIVIKFPMRKTGYVFAGWYTDPGYTEYYEVSNPAEAGEIILYARWVEADKAAQLNVKGATLVNSSVNPAGYGVVGETFHEPVAESKDGMKVLWYADEACTTLFDFSKTIESTDAVTIYAKYVEDSGEPETTPSETTAETTAGTETTQPTDDEKGGLPTGVIIGIVAVVVVVVVVVIVLAMKKKKK